MNFEADPKVAEIADAYAADLVDMGRSRYNVALDFSIESIDHVERIADDIASSKPRFSLFNKDLAKKTDTFTKMLGFYVAETMRRAWGGEHGWVETPEGNRFYGLRLVNGSLCWPVGRAQQRLAQGRENDLRSYVAGMRPDDAAIG